MPPECSLCHGARWVCEDHQHVDRCGAPLMPCPACQDAERPEMPEGWQSLVKGVEWAGMGMFDPDDRREPTPKERVQEEIAFRLYLESLERIMIKHGRGFERVQKDDGTFEIRQIPKQDPPA